MNIGGNSTNIFPNDQIQSEIFKLKMDHFEELFDWLSLEDLVMLGKTCQRMRRIVGYYFKTNYSAIKPRVESHGIYVEKVPSRDIKLKKLSAYVKRLKFTYLELIKYYWDEEINDCNWITKAIIPRITSDRFKWLTEIQCEVVFTEKGISRIKKILAQLETVKLVFPNFVNEDGELYDSFLQYCTKLKKLFVQGWTNTAIVGADNSWMHRKYPSLEHFELTTHDDESLTEEIKELQTFLAQNNIKYFATNVEKILANRNAFTNSQFEVLSIGFCDAETLISSREFLNDLHERGVFKQLHVYSTFIVHYPSNAKITQQTVNRLNLFSGFTKLYIKGMADETDLSVLNNLKQLCIGDASCVPDMEILSVKLNSIQFIQFKTAEFDNLLPFIRHSPKLSTIVVFNLDMNDENISKLEQVNKERVKLSNARKITIFVEESVYLRVKWIKSVTNWKLIEIKRGAGYEALNHSFDYFSDPDERF